MSLLMKLGCTCALLVLSAGAAVRSDTSDLKREFSVIYAEYDHVPGNPNMAAAFARKYLAKDFAYHIVIGGVRDRALVEHDLSGPPPAGLTLVQKSVVEKVSRDGDTALVQLRELDDTSAKIDGANVGSRTTELRRDTWVKTGDGWQAREWRSLRQISDGTGERTIQHFQELTRAPGGEESGAAEKQTIQKLYDEEARAVEQRHDHPEVLLDFVKRHWASDYHGTIFNGRVLSREQSEEAIRRASASPFRTVKATAHLEKLSSDGDKLIALIRGESEAAFTDEKGETGAAGTTYPFRATTYRRDTWVKAGSGWQLQVREDFGMVYFPAKAK